MLGFEIRGDSPVSMPHMSSAEVVHHLAFGDIFVQSPAVRWCLLHNCEVESLAVMRQLCSTFMRDVPRVINSKDWQLKHRCVILYKEFSRKQCTTLYRLDPTFYRQFFLYPQEAVWIAIITGSDMARPDLLMRQLASGMASSRVYSFIWTNFEVSPDSSRADYDPELQLALALSLSMHEQEQEQLQQEQLLQQRHLSTPPRDLGLQRGWTATSCCSDCLIS